MIISRTERIWTIIVAVLMLIASIAYLMSVHYMALPEAHMSWDQLSLGDAVLLCFPSAFLSIHAVLLLIFHRKRGVHIKSTWTVQDGSNYRGQKFPWM